MFKVVNQRRQRKLLGQQLVHDVDEHRYLRNDGKLTYVLWCRVWANLATLTTSRCVA